MVTKRTPARKAINPKNKAMAVPASEIPEVETLLQTESALVEFISKHAAVLDELAALSEARNNALQEADSAVRSMAVDRGVGINCGPFQFKHFTARINFEKMFDTLQEEDYARLSGVVQTVPNYTGDKETVLRAIRNGEIPTDIASGFYSNTPTYTSIKEFVLP